MTGAQYIVDQLVKRHVTDAFGIPGGVILELLYEMDNRRDVITPHLSYHEQTAGFAACGYAQSSGKLGVAYATRGPGFTNLITAIADAYYDSLPVLFITSHAANCPPEGMRTMADQEMDTCSMVKNITKYAVRIDNLETICDEINKACSIAMEGRKGPVMIDVASNLLKKHISEKSNRRCDNTVANESLNDIEDVARIIASEIESAKRPIILVGDGINLAGIRNAFRDFARMSGVPVISSRFSHDIMSNSNQYYGYVGSHGMRAANFILSKTDLIVSIGNRLHFPPKSESFGAILNHAKLLRIDIDSSEFHREIPNSECFNIDAKAFVNHSLLLSKDYGDHSDWVNVCNILRDELKSEDQNEAITTIVNILKQIDSYTIIVNDVGNNEFWVSRACVESGIRNRVYYSKSFGALGSGLGKAIGAYYATRKPVICFVGDQGLQMNIQELQFISQHKLPLTIVLLNNHSSGMIKDRELVAYGRFLHTTSESGFTSPDFKKIASAYGLKYIIRVCDMKIGLPQLLEIKIDENMSLEPLLPRGRECQDMVPNIPKDKLDFLTSL